jgi:hypothetical protein
MGMPLVLTAVLSILSGCHSMEIDSLPKGLIGVWETSAPEYAGRFFEFKENDVVTFGTGEGRSEVYPISNVERVAEVDGVLYRVHYADNEGEEHTFAFFWDASMSGVIRFKNRLGIEWRKAGEPG